MVGFDWSDTSEVGSRERPLEELTIVDGESGSLSPEASSFVPVFWKLVVG